MKIGSEPVNPAVLAEDSGQKAVRRVCAAKPGIGRASNHDRGETSLLHQSGTLLPFQVLRSGGGVDGVRERPTNRFKSERVMVEAAGIEPASVGG